MENKKIPKRELLKNFILKDEYNKQNKLNKICLNGTNEKYHKIKILNLRTSNKGKESKEDIDKVRLSFYKFIKKEYNISAHFNKNYFYEINEEKDDKIRSINNSFKGKKQDPPKSKNKYLGNKKILNLKNILFHNQILNNNLKY